MSQKSLSALDKRKQQLKKLTRMSKFFGMNVISVEKRKKDDKRRRYLVRLHEKTFHLAGHNRRGVKSFLELAQDSSKHKEHKEVSMK